MKRECSGLFHPRGDLGPLLRQTRFATFHERICPTCGGVQGIARVPITPPPVVRCERDHVDGSVCGGGIVNGRCLREDQHADYVAPEWDD